MDIPKIKLNQHELIIEYCKRNGKIIPAKLKESERAICGGWLGTETIRRCQELVERVKPSVLKYPVMYRWPSEGKFAVYALKPFVAQNPALERPFTPQITHFTAQGQKVCCVWAGRNGLHSSNCAELKPKELTKQGQLL